MVVHIATKLHEDVSFLTCLILPLLLSVSSLLATSVSFTFCHFHFIWFFFSNSVKNSSNSTSDCENQESKIIVRMENQRREAVSKVFIGIK